MSPELPFDLSNHPSAASFAGASILERMTVDTAALSDKLKGRAMGALKCLTEKQIEVLLQPLAAHNHCCIGNPGSCLMIDCFRCFDGIAQVCLERHLPPCVKQGLNCWPCKKTSSSSKQRIKLLCQHRLYSCCSKQMKLSLQRASREQWTACSTFYAVMQVKKN